MFAPNRLFYMMLNDVSMRASGRPKQLLPKHFNHIPYRKITFHVTLIFMALLTPSLQASVHPEYWVFESSAKPSLGLVWPNIQEQLTLGVNMLRVLRVKMSTNKPSWKSVVLESSLSVAWLDRTFNNC